MQITSTSSVREVLREYPATRAVFERAGLMGCGGPNGPDEPIAVFARAHGLEVAPLLDALRESVISAPVPCPALDGDGAERAARELPAQDRAEPEVENYRYYLRAAVLIGVLAGAALGAINLTWIAVWGFTESTPHWVWWPALIQGHGNAQLFGWAGLFILGIAMHSLPRMLQRPTPSPRLAGSIFALILGGLTLGVFAQPLSAIGVLPALFPVSMGLQWLGAVLFVRYLLGTVRRPREPWAAFIAAGALWFGIGATARLWLSLAAVLAGTPVPPPAGNAAYLHAMTWGFLLCFVLGYSLRLLPVFMGLAAGSRRAAWYALSLLTVGTAEEVVARLADLHHLSALAMGVTSLGLVWAFLALRLWSPSLSAGDGDTVWLGRFVRTAYTWLFIAAALLLGLRIAEAIGTVSTLHQHAFGGAARHAFTVGFVSLMMVGVAWRILPIFSGAPRPHPALAPLVFSLLLAGNTLRVSGQIAAGLWGGGWYAMMGLSGWLELMGVTLFAVDVVRLLARVPARERLPEAGPPVVLSLEAPVGPLVAHRPWLIPVFARHGMAQIANPIFQRTVGQHVTLDQACRRFNLEPEAFLVELRGADEAHATNYERPMINGQRPESGGGAPAGLITIDLPPTSHLR